MRKLDVVGTSEAAGILGVEVPRIARWRKSGKMPGLAADLDATPVWHRRDVERLRDEGEFSGEVKALPIVGLSEAAGMLGVDKSQIGRWRREGKFPKPKLDKRPLGEPWEPGAGLASTPLWTVESIEKFMQARAERRAERDERRAAREG